MSYFPMANCVPPIWPSHTLTALSTGPASAHTGVAFAFHQVCADAASVAWRTGKSTGSASVYPSTAVPVARIRYGALTKMSAFGFPGWMLPTPGYQFVYGNEGTSGIAGSAGVQRPAAMPAAL